jgi:hypothetical protein
MRRGGPIALLNVAIAHIVLSKYKDSSSAEYLESIGLTCRDHCPRPF